MYIICSEMNIYAFLLFFSFLSFLSFFFSLLTSLCKVEVGSTCATVIVTKILGDMLTSGHDTLSNAVNSYGLCRSGAIKQRNKL